MTKIFISQINHNKIIAHAKKFSPVEVCGILAGLGNKIIGVYPVPNILNSLTRFQMEPMKQLRVLTRIDSLGLDMIGYYHSHPEGPNRPSATDCEENHFPHVFSLIASKESGVWKIYPFLMSMHTFKKIDFQ